MNVTEIGRRGTGKSTLATYFAQQQPRRLYLDPKAYWRPVPGDTQARQRIVHGIHANVEPTDESLAEQWAHAPEIVYQPDDVRATWPWLMRMVRDHVSAHRRDRFALVLDEYGLIDQSWEMDDFDWLMRAAERDVVDIHLVAHRIIDIRPKWRTLIDQWAVFNVPLHGDADELAKTMPLEPEAFRELPPRAFYWWDDRVGKGRIVNNPRAWHVPFVPKLTPATVEA